MLLQQLLVLLLLLLLRRARARGECALSTPRVGSGSLAPA